MRMECQIAGFCGGEVTIKVKPENSEEQCYFI